MQKKQSAIAMQPVSIFPLSIFLLKKENLHSHDCLARSQKLFLFEFPKLCCEQGRNQLKLAFHFSLIQQPSAVIVFSSIIIFIFIFKLSKTFNYKNLTFKQLSYLPKNSWLITNRLKGKLIANFSYC